MVMQVVLMVAAFVMSICWLYLIADEVVSVLQALGLLASISTGTCTGTSHYTLVMTKQSAARTVYNTTIKCS